MITRKIKRAASVLASDPVLFYRLIASRSLPSPPALTAPVRKAFRGVTMEFDPGTDSGAAEKLARRYELHIIRVMERTLEAGDTFIDVGANIGYMSGTGAGLVGPTGQVHSFEPVPRYFQRLSQMAGMNPSFHIYANQSAVGDAPGTASISVAKTENIGWNTMVPGYMDADTVLETVEVPVITLSDYIADKSLTRIKLIKIDTEGFEIPVLRGLGPWLERSSERPTIICEVSHRAYKHLGCTLTELDEWLTQHGYRATRLYGGSETISVLDLEDLTDVLFVPA